MPLSLVATEVADVTPPETPEELAIEDGVLEWRPARGDVFWYRIYRSDRPDFTPGAATLLTYVDKGTTRFKDDAPGLDGRPLRGTWYVA